jgi:hypothetical protein
MQYLMSHHRPELLPYDGPDLLKDVPYLPPLEKATLESEGSRWIGHVARHLDYCMANSFPAYWDGSGVYVLRRIDKPQSCTDPLSPGRPEYIALVDVTYKETAVISIPDAAALLQFFSLVQPMLELQTDKRFQMDEKYGWSK